MTQTGGDLELDVLHQAWRRARASSRTQAVLLTGANGAGKTALLDELRRTIGPDAVVLAAAGIDTGPYALWRAALSPVADRAAGLVERWPGLAAVTAGSAAAPGLAEGVLALLARLCRDVPVLLTLDDLHAADPTSIALLDLVVRNPVRGPLLVVAAHRHADLPPTHPARRPLGSLARAPGVRSLALGSLPVAALVKLTRATWHGGPRDVDLTARERQVLHLVARGRSNGQVGAELGISTKTASVHVTNLLRKLGVRRREEAAALAAHWPL